MAEDTPQEEDEYEDAPHYEQDHRGTLILTLGIVSLCLHICSCTVLGLIPWLMGSSDLAKMREGVMDPEGRVQTRTGMILGIIAFCLFCFNMVILIAYFGFLYGMGILR